MMIVAVLCFLCCGFHIGVLMCSAMQRHKYLWVHGILALITGLFGASNWYFSWSCNAIN